MNVYVYICIYIEREIDRTVGIRGREKNCLPRYRLPQRLDAEPIAPDAVYTMGCAVPCCIKDVLMLARYIYVCMVSFLFFRPFVVVVVLSTKWVRRLLYDPCTRKKMVG